MESPVVTGIRARAALAAGAALLAVAVPRPAASQVTIEVFHGAPYNFRTPLRIEQSGQPDIRVTADYSTRPLTASPYFAWRVARGPDGHQWALEMIHHKLYLDNPPAGVQRFRITHGFNMFFVSRSSVAGPIRWRAGVGPVITHPESTVRGQSVPDGGGILDAGYFLSGAAVMGTAGKRFSFGDRFFGTLEARLTAAYARPLVAGGHASVPNVAIHLVGGIGGRL
jgi:hypothetical protein